MFQVQKSSVVRLFLVTGDNDSWACTEEILPEFEEGSFQALKCGGVSTSWDDDILSREWPGKVDWSLGGNIDAETVDITAGRLKNLTVSTSSDVGHI